MRTQPHHIALVSVELEELLWHDGLARVLLVLPARHFVENPALDGPVHHFLDGTDGAVTEDGAPGAPRPQLQHVGDTWGPPGTGSHPQSQVVSLLQQRVEKTALGLDAVPESDWSFAVSLWPI